MRYLSIILLALFVSACTNNSKDFAKLSGKIINKNSDSLLIRSQDYSKTLKVNPDGTFSDTLKLEADIYNVFDGKQSTLVFLKNGFDINMSFDAKQTNSSITFSGEGALHSNFIKDSNKKFQELFNVNKLSEMTVDSLTIEINSIKEELLNFYNTNKEIDTIITNRFKKQLDPMLNMYKNYLVRSIKLKQSIKKGEPSPIFKDYENYDGSKTSLTDFKGKYVYIDVWATWCGPCIAELPALEKLQHDFKDKNIAFISLSVDDGRGYRSNTPQDSKALAKEGWKKMITNKQLGGIQIIAPNGWQSQFIQDYKINGIPRFILIDPEGKIVTADAPRPSSRDIINLFNQLNI